MLSYQHIYHAGNPADIHKHLWLVTVLAYLRQKEAPLTWIDTHGGRGLYDLTAPEALKRKEFEAGLFPVLDFFNTAPPDSLPAPLRHYRDILMACNPDRSGRPSCYPGSAFIAAQMLRPTDSLHSFDLHPAEYAHLAQSLKPFSHAHIQKSDGTQALHALLPPVSRRGGALIDPSYEIKTEYTEIFEHLQSALKRFPQGTFMIWYPLLPAGRHHDLTAPCQSLPYPYEIDEWHFTPPHDKPHGLYGSGMILVNPPYTTPKTMAHIKSLILPVLMASERI